MMGNVVLPAPRAYERVRFKKAPTSIGLEKQQIASKQAV
jgi:hypothetical protein